MKTLLFASALMIGLILSINVKKVKQPVLLCLDNQMSIYEIHNYVTRPDLVIDTQTGRLFSQYQCENK